ncbi:TetR/AcrR family transcriptional regulator [Herbiconiux moechotypicola]|uniref:HTH tetR-type domain-containing protein n=1 Tax=Herbiconiux moechotypicola TaxID=637393 RepID=A0ABN3DR94_9MICO|nr:TetR/AcrR family transcriptional regulator [Herbiconiux moechotypicola]MCS5731478.1 TetR/AcrR family transcriptional regulator [Herbiconiux moechotypicola]
MVDPYPTDLHHRRARIRAAEVRRRVLDVALERVQGVGLTIGFEHIVMDDLIREAGVPRSSTYRLWDSKESFIADLLVEIATEVSTRLADDETLEISERILFDNIESLASGEERERVMYEVIRVALEHNFRAVIASRPWQSYVGLTATLLSDLDAYPRSEIDEALRSGSDAFIERMAEFHKWFSTILGYRMRAEWNDDYRPYAVVISSVVEGLGLRHLGNPGVVDAVYRGPATIEGDDPDWKLPAIALVAILERFLEHDPDYDVQSTMAMLREMKVQREAAADASSADPDAAGLELGVAGEGETGRVGE